MRIETLQAFLKVIETESFTQAAEQLFISQSTLSKRIAELEKEVGRQLLQRSTRSVRATQAGRVFMRHAVRIVEEWEALKTAMNSICQQEKERICIGYTASQQLPFIHQAVRQSGLSAQGVEIVPQREVPDRLMQMLRDGRMDCALMHRPTMHLAEDMHETVVLQSKLIAMMRKDHRLAGRKELTLAELSVETDVRCVRAKDPYYYDVIDQDFLQAGLTPPRYVETGEPEELVFLADHSDRLMLCPSVYPGWEGYVSIPIADTRVDFDLLFVRHRDNGHPHMDMLEAAFVRRIRKGK